MNQKTKLSGIYKKQKSDKTLDVWWFFGLTFLISWTLWLPSVIETQGIIATNTFPPVFTTICMIIGGLAPSLAAVVLIYFYGKPGGLKSLFKRAVIWRLGKTYILLVFMIPAIVFGAHAVKVYLLGGSWPSHDIYQEPWMIPALLFLMLLLQLGEEFGWRGFALDRLQKKFGSIYASLILGLIWALWHLPMFLAVGFGHHDNQLPFFHLATTLVLMSFIITWAQNKSGNSLLPAFFLHASINLSGEIMPLSHIRADGVVDSSSWVLVNLLLAIYVLTFIVKDMKSRNG